VLGPSPVIAFVATTDQQRAKAFSAGTLGLRLTGEDPFALVFDTAGTMLRVATVQAFQRYDGMPQDERGIWTSPGGARIAWFLDPDGNTLSLTEFAPVVR
jgi:catechol 2,3-dioxygenase-like lactoylglutathione lyase family enzyme